MGLRLDSECRQEGLFDLANPRVRKHAQLRGFDELLVKRYLGDPFVFHLVGVLANLRAVQHALKGYDRTLSTRPDG